ncbi:MAG TPA: hypothetical protein VHH12_15150, partial [Mycobacterium sp.]|nr:hypothetical protein [Mycobacterium sp.]
MTTGITTRAGQPNGGGSAAAVGPDHGLRWFGLRFASHETERQYRKWRIATATPFARVGYIGSIPSWCLLLVAVILIDEDSVAKTVPPIAGWIVLLIALTALTLPEALRPSVMPLAAVANCLAGFLIVWMLSDLLLTSEAPAWRAGAMTGGMLIVMFFGFAIFRVPPIFAMAAVTPYVAYASYRLDCADPPGIVTVVEAVGGVRDIWRHSRHRKDGWHPKDREAEEHHD